MTDQKLRIRPFIARLAREEAQTFARSWPKEPDSVTADIARDAFMDLQFSADDGVLRDSDREPFIFAFSKAYAAIREALS